MKLSFIFISQGKSIWGRFVWQLLPHSIGDGVKIFVVATKKNWSVVHKNKRRKERGKMKNKLLSFGMLLALTITTISPANAVSLASLRNSLSKVCISDRATCGTVFEGIYNTSTNSCTCHNSSFMRYDSNLRKCVIKCPVGYNCYISAGTSCSRGYKKYKIERRALNSNERG